MAKKEPSAPQDASKDGPKNPEFGARLTRLMKDRGETNVGLGARIGVSDAAISRYKSGRIPKRAILTRLCEALESSEEELLPRPPGSRRPEGEESMPPELVRFFEGHAATLKQQRAIKRALASLRSGPEQTIDKDQLEILLGLLQELDKELKEG